MEKTLRIGVTGLNATDNPAPGVGVLRSLRESGLPVHLVGLAYDALDPGIYAKDLVREVYMLPYPTHGISAFGARLSQIQEQAALDVIIPTLDSELPSFIELEQDLRELGVRLFLPTRAQLDLRQKSQLVELGRRADIAVPATAVVTTIEELRRVHDRVPYPFFVKGVFYGATLAHNLDDAAHAFYKAVAQWGAPIVVQTFIAGEEFNVVAVGDGRGGLVGAVPMKKMMITDKGKGWAGITVNDPALHALTASFMRATSWRGPCEIEVMRDAKGRYHLIEINPRFPAWVYLSVAAGVNLPQAVVALALGQEPPTWECYEVGAMFVRISIDQVAHIGDFQSMVTTGQLVREQGGAR